MNKNKYDPHLEIVEYFTWVIENIRERKGTLDEKRFFEIGIHLEKEIQKYIYE